MTGFRISYGGAQKHFGITPDLSTFGKVIGGGLPVGAYAGKKKIMEMVAPAGPMYQAGTLSGNPLAMMAGIKTLEILKQPGTYKQLDEKTGKLINGILDAGKAAGHAVCGGHISGMFGFFFCEGPIKCALDSSFLPLSKERFSSSSHAERNPPSPSHPALTAPGASPTPPPTRTPRSLRSGTADCSSAACTLRPLRTWCALRAKSPH